MKPVASEFDDFSSALSDLADSVSAAKQESASLPPGTPQQVSAEQRTEKNLAAIEDIGTTHKTNAKAQLAVAQTLSAVQENARALPFAGQAVALAQSQGNPKLLAQALVLRGGLLQKEGKNRAAYEDAVKALTFEPGNRAAYGLAMLTKGLPDKYESDATRPARTASAAPSAPSASPAAEGPAMTSPASLKAQTWIKEAAAKLSLDPQAAILALDKAVAAEPKNAQAYLLRGKAKLALGQVDPARHDLGAAIKRDPKLAEAYALRAKTRELLAEGPAIILEDLEAAAILDPARFEAGYREAITRLTEAGADATGTQAAGEAQAGASLTGWLMRSQERTPAWPLAAALLLLFVAARWLLKRRGSRSEKPE